MAILYKLNFFFHKNSKKHENKAANFVLLAQSRNNIG